MGLIDAVNAAAANADYALAEAAAKRLQDAGVRHRSARADGGKPAEPWYRIQNKADDDTVAQVDIYDEIDWYWGVTAKNFRNELKALPDSVDTIELHINSPGGDVYEAIAIMNSLRQHKARVVTTVDGYAASSAGFIAVGASDELIIAENSELMAHLPWAVMVGDAHDMRKMADDLERIGRNIASIFAARAGGSVDEWIDVLTAETWWSAQEAVDAGIADKVLAAPKRDAKNAARNRFDLSVFNHAGRSQAPAPRIPQAHNQTPQPVEAEASEREEPTVGTLSESALQKLGLDADADADAIEAAIGALAEKAEQGGETPSEVTIEEATQIAAKFGMTVVNREAYDKMAATVADLSAAREQQIAAENEAAIQAALGDGRISLKVADTWRDELAKNRESTLALLNTLPRNSAVPVDEIGHGVTRDDAPEDAEKSGVFALITGRKIEGA
ncbi:capsid maturation protease [Mycobacterium phage KilKor]|uniref:Capsid maturation protease n=2 Tax=Fishburnevirus TaxID=1983734 RepID=A0A222ZJR5_9CAUD|nr:head maturation protease [Mycobacterium phage Megiddo]YP_009964572.1 head maturation protease [Mycobacterium phage Ksquared]YP_010001305.1 head maturation protease [Mycobacterium phage KilKor]QDK01194.1 capsid maturation protease [Mycobacterium phage Bunnies]QHB41271.1 capsid maturation protease [Mycobacterium phage Phalm]QHB41428.1 capsid maturation protease [Mycobacterium phage Glaske]QHJ86262.1 capsid maturation protease [Mycobacterium phage CactusJack]QIG57597.1 capsid maturation prot